MKRILIIGSAGAGKTTLACYLSRQFVLPLIHLDQKFWHPGWVAPSAESWQQQIAQVIAQPAWIIDGYYRNTLDITYRAADTIIFLDISHLICIYRICMRYLTHKLLHRVRSDLPEGCPERLRWSFLSWVWTFPQKQRPIILNTIQEAEERQHVIIIHNQTELVQLCHWVRDYQRVPSSTSGR